MTVDQTSLGGLHAEFADGDSVKGNDIYDETYFRIRYEERTADWYGGLLADVIHFGRPGSVLDLGCGLGLFVELANRWGIPTTGVDCSEAGLRLARERAPGIDLLRCDLLHGLPFRDQSFDDVLINQVITYFPPGAAAKVFSESYRLLKPGGMLFLLSTSKLNRKLLRKDPMHFCPLHPSELRAALQSAGFSIILEPNSPRFSPRFRILSRLVNRLMRTRLQDWASGTANAYAVRPRDGRP